MSIMQFLLLFHRLNSIPYSGGSSKFSVSIVSSFLFPEFQALIITKIHLKHYKVSPCVFNFSFFLSSFCLPEFFMEALHGGSSRILFILQLFIKDFFHSPFGLQDFSRSYDPPSYTQN
ncbi:hypothetical protein ACQJBY_006905 [Aegilops geniculata]